MMKVFITGGAGFVGSNYIHYALKNHPDWDIVNVDKLTYAGNLNNLTSVMNHPKHKFIKGDIADAPFIDDILKQGFELVVNFAAETHVDRSILDPTPFIQTNMVGTQVLLDAVKKFKIPRILHISTPEVYGGASPATGKFKEDAPFMPNNPYSASKAGGDLICRAYFRTYGINYCLSRFANAYGPYQYPEKLIPLTITYALQDKPIPVYGNGQDRRNWIYVDDVCQALDLIIAKGRPGEAYNIPSQYEMTNLELVKRILKILQKSEKLITFVAERPAHDWQYPLHGSKIAKELKWKMSVPFERALNETIQWYVQNKKWWQELKVLDYREYYQKIAESKKKD